MTKEPVVLYEDNHCLAMDKPAGLLTMGDHTGEPTLVDAVREYLREKYQKPGNVFVGVVHRLDRPVSGVVVFARTSTACLITDLRPPHLTGTNHGRQPTTCHMAQAMVLGSAIF